MALTCFVLCWNISLLLGCWLLFFPESPKFLIEIGETEEALEILRYMYEENTGKQRSEYPVIFILSSSVDKRHLHQTKISIL